MFYHRVSVHGGQWTAGRVRTKPESFPVRIKETRREQEGGAATADMAMSKKEHVILPRRPATARGNEKYETSLATITPFPDGGGFPFNSLLPGVENRQRLRDEVVWVMEGVQV